MRLYYRLARFLSQWSFVLCFRGRVFGLRHVPTTGGVLLVCNHQSFYDPIAATLAVHREGNYMARDTLFRHWLFARLIQSLNAFPVRRGVADVGAVKEVLRRLKAGKLVLIFPEATRTRDGTIGPINANSMAVAKKARVPIVPVVIDGLFEAWPRHRPLPRPWAVHVTYAEPLTAEQVRDWSTEKIVRTVTERLTATLAASQQKRHRACAASCAPQAPSWPDGSDDGSPGRSAAKPLVAAPFNYPPPRIGG